MLRNKIIAISCLLLTITAACEKEIELKQEEIDPRIVVNAVVTAGDTVFIELSESRNVLYENNLPQITNATAKLTDGNGTVIGNFTHLGEGRYYTTDVIPVAGNRYGITVASEGLTPVKAFTDIPSSVPFISVDTASFPDKDEMRFTLKFNENGSEKNYYAVTISLYSAYENEFGEIEYNIFSYFATSEFYVVNGGDGIGGDGEKYASTFLFPDDLISGQTVTFEGRTNYGFETAENSFYLVELTSLSEELYKYQLSYNKYLETQGSPFAQPVQVYSNIDEGFGIFAGGSIQRDTIYIE